MDATEAARILFEEGLNGQDFTNVRRVLADEVPYHLEGETLTINAAWLEAEMVRWHTGLPDFRFDVHSITADDHVAAVRATLRGTQTGPWGEQQATGRSIAVEHAFFLRFEDGVIVELWEIVDRSTLHAQMTGDQSA